ncbi:hypothetical protein ACFL60_06255 [Candidatus Omnitrophota bacterium]
MHKTSTIIMVTAAVLLMALCLHSFAKSESPVRIQFDEQSKRIDCVSGKKLPNYTLAQRGSFQFFFGRFDTPEKGFWYMFDGRGYQDIENLALIRKMPSIGAWAIIGGGGWRRSKDSTIRTSPMNICEIMHHAVSFIPLNPVTKKPEPRIYLLLDDMYLIQWKEVDHWVATKSQKEFESEQGIVY